MSVCTAAPGFPPYAAPAGYQVMPQQQQPVTSHPGCNYGRILYSFRNKARYSSKNGVRQFLSRVTILTRDIDIANLSVRLSVGYVPVSDENGLTYRHSFFHHTVAQSF